MRAPDDHDQPSVPRWLTTARRYVGTRELVGNALNPIVRAMFNHTRFPAEDVTAKTSWCAAFVSMALDTSGIRSARTAAARHYLAWGVRLAAPVPGAVLVFSRGESLTYGHVGFCDRPVVQSAHNVLVLGGNQSNSVCLAWKPLDQLIGVRWPVAVEIPKGAIKI